MWRLLNSICLFVFSSHLFANHSPSLYQVDLIVFTPLETTLNTNHTRAKLLLPKDTRDAIPLEHNPKNLGTPFQLLPSSSSQLREEYWALNHKPSYQILFHYTWLQPSNNLRPIVFPAKQTGGWTVEGTFAIKKTNYYQLETDLLFSAPQSPQPPFVFAQKHRLKPEVVYYLDHPQAGMLIKIHPLT